MHHVNLLGHRKNLLNMTLTLASTLNSIESIAAVSDLNVLKLLNFIVFASAVGLQFLKRLYGIPLLKSIQDWGCIHKTF